MKGKFQIILIEDEFGSKIRRFLISKKLVFGVLLFTVSFTAFTTVYSLYITAKYRSSTTEKKVLREKVLAQEAENRRINAQLEKLKAERESTVKELAKRVKIIDNLMKKVGISTPERDSGGLSIPIEELAKDLDEIELSQIIPDVDKLIEKFRYTPFGKPVEGRITSPFGLRRNPITGRIEFHLGVDIANKIGTPIKATADGIVVKAGWCGLMGRCVEIKHGKKTKTIYAHLLRIFVKKGDKVERGDVIGLLGNSGRSTGPHLHYSVKINGKYVNPVLLWEVAKNVEKKRRRTHGNKKHSLGRLKN